MNEVVVSENQLTADIDFKAKATEWLQNMGTQLPPAQTAQFLELCQCYKLNPFKREIYAVGYGNKFNIIVGYEVYLKRAERTGKLDGWQCVVNDDGTKAKITIWRKDWSHPFEHVVFMNEVRQNSPIWQKMPTFMMRKVCVEQGMRLAFPDEMGGMPYCEEEVSYDRIIQSEDLRPVNDACAEQVRAEDNYRDADVMQENKKQKASDLATAQDKMKLKNLLENYENDLSGKPYELSCEALADNDPAKISEMLGRCISYLGKKGIKVA